MTFRERPALGGVEGDNANRSLVLARHQIVDRGFEIGLSDIGFGKGDAPLSVIVDGKVILIVAGAPATVTVPLDATAGN